MVDDFFTYQGRRAEPSRAVGKAPAIPPAPLEPYRPRAEDRISVAEHPASTTIVQQIRGALLRRLRGE